MVLRGVALNLGLAAVKLAGGVFGNTYALVADAAESLLDVVSSLLVWAGFRVAARPPDADHPYGHGKAEALAALGVAAFVFGMSGLVGYHAVREIITPHSAFYTPQAWDDIRTKSAETMRAALLGPKAQNVIDPSSY